MFVRNELGAAPTPPKACVVPATVSLRKLVVTDADRAGIGTALALGRAATLAEVRATITGAITRALALIAVAEGQLKRPRLPGVRGQKMRDDYFDTFGTTPEFVPKWRPAGERWDRGDIVRERLRCAAKILAEGDIEFVAWGASCPHRTVWPDTLWASVLAGRYRICIGPRFWRAAREKDVDGMATTFLHEALHIYFDTIRHRLERGPYNMAACYERYVLVANGIRVPDDVSGPCPPKRPVGDFPVPARDAPRMAGIGAPADRSQILSTTSTRTPECRMYLTDERKHPTTHRFGLGSLGEPATCAPQGGEVAASRTAAGILTSDVERGENRILVTDFGVDRADVKPGTQSELASVLAALDAPDVTAIRITGFDDCLRATPTRHAWLRKRRAQQVMNLLGPTARAKVVRADGAPAGTFVGPNNNRAARARNRSVLIEFDRTAPAQPPTQTQPPPRKINLTPSPDFLKTLCIGPMSDEEELACRLKEILKRQPPTATTSGRSVSGAVWDATDRLLDSVLNKAGVPKRWHKTIKEKARDAIEKGARKALGAALDAAGASGSTKKAIEGVVDHVVTTPVR